MTGRLSAPRSSACHTALLAFVLTLAAGCGSRTTVSGTVTYKGVPLAGGSVNLVSADGVVYSGAIGPDGTYTIPDVPTGPVAIGVVGPVPAGPGGRPTPTPRGDATGAAGSARPRPADPAPPLPPAAAPPTNGSHIPEAYRDPRTSRLTGTVRTGELLNIDLK